MRKDVELTQAHLARFTYNDPNVRLELRRPIGVPRRYKQDYAYRNFGDAFYVIITTEDTYRPGRQVEVCHTYAVPPFFFGDEEIWLFLRTCIHRAVTHEADERIWVDGEMMFDPHAHEKPKEAPPWTMTALPESLRTKENS